MRCQILQPLTHSLQKLNFLYYGGRYRVDITQRGPLEGGTTLAPGRQVKMDPKVVWLLVIISDLPLFKTSPSSSASCITLRSCKMSAQDPPKDMPFTYKMQNSDLSC